MCIAWRRFIHVLINTFKTNYIRIYHCLLFCYMITFVRRCLSRNPKISLKCPEDEIEFEARKKEFGACPQTGHIYQCLPTKTEDVVEMCRENDIIHGKKCPYATVERSPLKVKIVEFLDCVDETRGCPGNVTQTFNTYLYKGCFPFYDSQTKDTTIQTSNTIFTEHGKTLLITGSTTSAMSRHGESGFDSTIFGCIISLLVFTILVSICFILKRHTCRTAKTEPERNSTEPSVEEGQAQSFRESRMYYEIPDSIVDDVERSPINDQKKNVDCPTSDDFYSYKTSELTIHG